MFTYVKSIALYVVLNKILSQETMVFSGVFGIEFSTPQGTELKNKMIPTQQVLKSNYLNRE